MPFNATCQSNGSSVSRTFSCLHFTNQLTMMIGCGEWVTLTVCPGWRNTIPSCLEGFSLGLLLMFDTQNRVLDYWIFLTPKQTMSIIQINLFIYIFSAGADGDGRSQVCLHLTLRSAPHRHHQKFFSAHVWEGWRQTKFV
jgi:hypothetical protein